MNIDNPKIIPSQSNNKNLERYLLKKKGGSDGDSSEAIKYTSQILTEDQKSQARENIDAYKKPSTGIPASDLALGVIPAPEVFVATYGTTTYNDVATAISANKVVMCNYDGKTYYATMVSGNILFGSVSVGTFRILTLTSADAWSVSIFNSENEANKKTTLSGNEASNAYYPTTKAVVDYVDDAVDTPVESTQPAGGFLPNVLYDLGTLTGTVTFALASPTDNTIPNPYHWTFDTGSTAPTITWPSGIVWPDGFTPTVDANKHYEVLVRNGYASILVFSLSA